MRVFVQNNAQERGSDAMKRNPGNLYFYFGPNEQLPVICPFRGEAAKDGERLADYIVCGPTGWYLVKDASSGLIRISEIRQSIPF